jgi:hypothetical protein
LYPSFGFPGIYRQTLWDPRLGHLSPPFHMQDGGLGMENMSFDDLGLLLGVIETRMVLHILVHRLRFPVLQCDIFTYSVSILIPPPYACLKCELLLCSLDLVACIMIALSCILLLVRLDLFTILCHNALVTTHVCSIMVFVSSVDVTFSWQVSTPVLR